MGRLRGQRNRDQDRYWHERRRAEQSGMLAAAEAVPCLRCGFLAAIPTLYKGWCLDCVCAWVDTVDPWLIAQHRGDLPVAAVPSALVSRIDRLQERIIRPVPDEAFLPLTQFMGHHGLGSQKTLWNALQALYVFELETTAEAFKLGIHAPNTLHLCGRHAPIQRSSLQGYLSRIASAAETFSLLREDARLLDYLQGFVSDNNITLFQYQKTSVDVLARWQYARSWARYGKPHFDKHAPVHWPFEAETNRVEMPDVVMEIGELVPINMPESLRQDLCQDLVVAVLGGETTMEQLRGSMRFYVREAFRHHPLKYGRYSLDQSSARDTFKGEEYNKQGDSLTDEDTDLGRAPKSMPHVGWPREPIDEMHGWHHGKGRPRGLASVGQQLRDKHDGVAIPVGAPPSYDDADMDPEILAVFMEAQTPRWRQKLSDR